MKTLWLVIGVAIAALFLYLAFRGVRMEELLGALTSASYGWLLPATVLYAADYWLRAERWRELVAPIHTAPTRRLLSLLVLGNTVNNVLPARVGDVTRAMLCKVRFGMSRSAALATIVVEKIFDGVATLAFFVAAAHFSPLWWGKHTVSGSFVGKFSEDQFVTWVQRLIGVAGWVFLLALACCAVGIALQSRAAALIERLARVLPGRAGAAAHRFGRMFLEGLAVFRSPAGLVAAALLSAGIWACEAGVYYCVARAFGILLPAAALLMLVSLVNLAVTIPSTPGFWGTFEIASVGVLKLFGVSQGLAGAFTLVVHVFLIVTVVAAGSVAMVREHLHISELREIERGALAGEPEGQA